MDQLQNLVYNAPTETSELHSIYKKWFNCQDVANKYISKYLPTWRFSNWRNKVSVWIILVHVFDSWSLYSESNALPKKQRLKFGKYMIQYAYHLLEVGQGFLFWTILLNYLLGEEVSYGGEKLSINILNKTKRFEQKELKKELNLPVNETKKKW